MSRTEHERLADVLADVLAALDAIERHTAYGDLSDGLVFDAVRVRLMEIGEAVKGLTPGALAAGPGIPWREVAGMRDKLVYDYFDTQHGIVDSTVRHDLAPLRAAVERLLDRPA